MHMCKSIRSIQKHVMALFIYKNLTSYKGVSLLRGGRVGTSVEDGT